MNLTDSDKLEIANRYPGLQIDSKENKYLIKGCLEFRAAFDSSSKQYILNPGVEGENLPVIKDVYQIEIILPKAQGILPSVKETSGRISREPDCHKYSDDSLCLVGPLDNIEVFSFIDFLEGPVLQFFYDQSYYGLYDGWPRGEYSHGVLGVIENYFNNLGQSLIEEKCLKLLKEDTAWEVFRAILLGKKIKGHHSCVCGSGKSYRNCHVEVFFGLWNLQAYIKSNGLKTLLNK